MRVYVDGIVPASLRNFHKHNKPCYHTIQNYIHGETETVAIRDGVPYLVRHIDGRIENNEVNGRQAIIDYSQILYGRSQFQIPYPSVDEKIDKRVYCNKFENVQFVTEHSNTHCIDCYFEGSGCTRDILLAGTATLMSDLNFCSD